MRGFVLDVLAQHSAGANTKRGAGGVPAGRRHLRAIGLNALTASCALLTACGAQGASHHGSHSDQHGPAAVSAHCAAAAGAKDGVGPDVKNMRLGMKPKSITDILVCLSKNENVSPSQGYSRASNRDYQTFSLRSGAVLPDAEISADIGSELTSGRGATPHFSPPSESFYVLFAGLKGREQTTEITRTVQFRDNRPTVSTVIDGLVKKYGEPTSKAYGTNAVVLWVNDRSGNRMSPNNPAYDSCANAATNYLVEPACGLTIVALVGTNEPGDAADEKAASEMTVFVTDHGLAKRLLDEEKAYFDKINRPTGKGPDL